MFRNTQSRRVVFTQGYPALEHFAKAHFLPSNPLSSSPIWLDEDDFKSAAMIAKKYGHVQPLRIDPYAHHPRLSRYAAGTAPSTHVSSSGSSGGSRSRQSKKKKVEEALLSSEASALAEAAQADDLRRLLTVDQARVAPPQDRRGPSEQSTPPRRGRGRPRKAVSKPSVDVVSAERVTALTVADYKVPICSVSIVKPLYLLNLDQMTSRRPGHDALDYLGGPATAGGDAMDSEADVCGAERGGVASVFRIPATGSLRMPSDGKHAYLMDGPADAAEGVRRLQLQFPNPVDPEPVMYSIGTRNKYAVQRQVDLRRIAARYGYRSRWWGTQAQWYGCGAVKQLGQQPHVLPFWMLSKLVHISLIENAQALLQQSFISPRTRRLVLCGNVSQHSGADRDGDGDDDHQHAALLNGVLASNASQSLSRTPDSGSGFYGHPFFRTLHREISADMMENGYRIPLYLQRYEIESLGGALRPGARGIVLSQNHTGFSGAASDEEDGYGSTVTALPTFTTSGARVRTAQHQQQCWYHLSQVHFPATYLLSSAVLSAEMQHPGVALHGTTGARLPFPELTYEALVDHHPEIAAVLRGGLAGSGAAAETHRIVVPPARLSVQDGEAPEGHDGFDEWAAGSEAASQPEESDGGNRGGAGGGGGGDAATVPVASTELDEAAVARFVATHASPRVTRGRHLWFRAEDVLAANGIVDVNSAPVEVTVDAAETFCLAGGSEVVSSREAAGADGVKVYFNVECLENPDDALRKLTLPFSAM